MRHDRFWHHVWGMTRSGASLASSLLQPGGLRASNGAPIALIPRLVVVFSMVTQACHFSVPLGKLFDDALLAASVITGCGEVGRPDEWLRCVCQTSRSFPVTRMKGIERDGLQMDPTTVVKCKLQACNILDEPISSLYTTSRLARS